MDKKNSFGRIIIQTKGRPHDKTKAINKGLEKQPGGCGCKFASYITEEYLNSEIKRWVDQLKKVTKNTSSKTHIHGNTSNFFIRCPLTGLFGRFDIIDYSRRNGGSSDVIARKIRHYYNA